MEKFGGSNAGEHAVCPKMGIPGGKLQEDEAQRIVLHEKIREEMD